jgi:hypothetical protein
MWTWVTKRIIRPNYTTILRSAFAQRGNPTSIAISCEVYIVFHDEKQIKGTATAAKKLGLNFKDKHQPNGPRNAIRVGYDNQDGITHGNTMAIVAALKASGISCDIYIQLD